jgi:hypothetical protein
MRAWHTVPEVRPSELRDKLLVAWIAYHSKQNELRGGKAHCQVSILYLQMLFCYSTPGGAERSLNRLRASSTKFGAPWLEISQYARGVLGHHYRLGHPATANKEAWEQLGECLFGASGHLEPFRSRPLFSVNGITPFGCLLLSFVNSFGPVTETEITDALETFYSRVQIKKRLRYIENDGLIHKKRDRYFTKPNIRSIVERFEKLTGASEKHRLVENSRDKQWIAFQTEVLGKPEIRMLKSALRKLDCFYCAATPPPTGGQVEHFPPKKWGGSDTTSLLLPICKKCNGRHGRLLGIHSKAAIKLAPKRLRMPWDGDLESATTHILLRTLAQNMHYAIAMNDGRINDAYEAAKSVAVIWAAARGIELKLDVIKKTTGEIEVMGSTDEFEQFSEFLNSYRGIPALMKS